MKLHKNIVSAIFLSIAANVSGAEDATYLCVSEESTGFYYENKSWGRVHFNVSDDKYILRKIKETEFGFKDKENAYGVFELGDKSSEFRCSTDEGSNEFICKSGLGQFLFSAESGRFIKTYTAGYWNGVNNNENTPNITRGRCSRI